MVSLSDDDIFLLQSRLNTDIKNMEKIVEENNLKPRVKQIFINGIRRRKEIHSKLDFFIQQD